MKNTSLVEIALETLKVIENGFYRNNLGQEISIREATDFAVENSESIRPEDFPPSFDLKKSVGEMSVTVTDETTLEAAKRICREDTKANPFVLNFANGFQPGGGFLIGAKAQEESLARASALYPCLIACPEMYEFNRRQQTELCSDWMIYSPQVPVFRNDDGSFLKEPYLVSFLTSPAVNAGFLLQKEPDKAEMIYSVNKERIRKFLRLASQKEHPILILGAWGCGAFRNDVDDIAGTFKDLLQNEFVNRFERVIFAIYDTTQTRKVYKTFSEVLHNK